MAAGRKCPTFKSNWNILAWCLPQTKTWNQNIQILSFSHCLKLKDFHLVSSQRNQNFSPLFEAERFPHPASSQRNPDFPPSVWSWKASPSSSMRNPDFPRPASCPPPLGRLLYRARRLLMIMRGREGSRALYLETIQSFLPNQHQRRAHPPILIWLAPIIISAPTLSTPTISTPYYIHFHYICLFQMQHSSSGSGHPDTKSKKVGYAIDPR